ncbi:uncharacterized protein V1518DRAFT_398909 [Limtongia smithiae]|uniref:uncharacterized protein n=1 Tax=Limtongia smithiae TaxID=1125753 RepID=UPI0034CF88ED
MDSAVLQVPPAVGTEVKPEVAIEPELAARDQGHNADGRGGATSNRPEPAVTAVTLATSGTTARTTSPLPPTSSSLFSSRKQTSKEPRRSDSRAASPPTESKITKKSSRAKTARRDAIPQYLSPLRTRPPAHKQGDLTSVPRLPLFLSQPGFVDPLCPRTGDRIRMYLTDDHPFNRRGFRYIPCEADDAFTSLMYRETEMPPYGARVDYADMSMQTLVDRDTSCTISTDKGYRTARANVSVREGRWFWECRIVRGNTAAAEDGNVRVGWSRREASLETPVGFDAYGYGIRDVTGQKFYVSRATDFMDEPFQTGDVIGLYISLPPMQYQVQAAAAAAAAGIKAGQIGAAAVPKLSLKQYKSQAPTLSAESNVLRDRFTIRYKGQLYFEQFDYMPAHDMNNLLNQSSSEDVQARLRRLHSQGLPGSCIKVYKNGKYVGTPFDNLLPFLPPHSEPLNMPGARVVDDGRLGYFPTVSVYQGGTAQFNFGPDFDFYPGDLRGGNKHEIFKTVRPMSERYDEQIAEDIVWDVIDEVELSLEGNFDDDRRTSDDGRGPQP